MEDDAIKRLIGNFYVLQGYIRDLHLKLKAMEEILEEGAPVHYERYRRLARQFEIESTPETTFPLEDIEGLRKALLQDH